MADADALPFSLDTMARRLLVDGAPVALGARAFDVLAYLDTHRERVVTKVELLDAVWGGMTVEEGNLTVQISALRKVLGAKAIATVPGVGYKLALGGEVPVPRSTAPVAEKPSVAVLPFTNLTGNPEQAFFAEGIARELVAALTRIQALTVLSGRAAAPAAAGVAPDTPQTYGARYVLEGSIQQAGKALRVTAQLTEAGTSRSLWSDRFNGQMDDAFGLQDRVVEVTAAAIEPSLVFLEAERVGASTQDMKAHDLCLRATPLVFRLGSRDQYLLAKSLLEDALGKDPGYVYAKGLVCRLSAWGCGARFIGFTEARACLPLAEDVLAATEADPLSMIFAGHALAYLDDQRARGVVVAKRAFAMSPNSSILLASAGWMHNYAGEADAAVEYFERSLRLNPLDPYVGQTRSGLGTAHCIAGRWETAITVLEQAYAEAPEFGTVVQNLAVAQWIAGDRERARVLMAELLSRPSVVTISGYEQNSPFRGLPFHGQIVEALRALGMPE